MAKATAAAKQKPIKALKSQGKKVANSPIMERLTRLGYAIKGFLYVTIGFIAIGGALGKNNTPADQLGAIVTFSKLPLAELLLWVILIGLVSYSLWGVIRAVVDPFHKGTDIEGLSMRAGYLVSAASYATFAIPTYQLISGGRAGTGTNGTVEMVSSIMNMPMGRWLVAALGAAAIAAGVYQVWTGIALSFEQRFMPYALTADQFRIAIQVGRFGTIARGTVFALAGVFLCIAAYQANPGQARGFDGALDFLARQPYGVWMLAVIALGLIAFGLYSFLSAAWFQLKR